MSCSGKLLGSKTGTLMCLQKKGMTEAGGDGGQKSTNTATRNFHSLHRKKKTREAFSAGGR